MALAFDASAIKAFTAGSPVTFSHTCTGSDRILIVFVWDTAGTSHGTTGVTYNGVSMTQIGTAQTHPTTGVSSTSAWYLIAPATGSNTISIATTTAGSTAAVAMSYTGAKQSGQPDSNAKNSYNTTAHTTWSLSTTVVASNCWLAAGMVDDSNAPTAGASTTMRQNSASGFGGFDSNGTVSTGSQTLNFAFSSSGKQTGIIVSIAPSVATATTNPAFLLNFI